MKYDTLKLSECLCTTPGDDKIKWAFVYKIVGLLLTC